jgi:DNA invertase Pin-like site-specific DNA recombinase
VKPRDGALDKTDRLSRSLLDYAQIAADAQREGRTLLAFDAPADPSTPRGEMMSTMLATFATFERRLIGERTRRALAEKRAAGVKLGRPRAIAGDVRDRMISARAGGRTLQGIADDLNAERVPTGHGGAMWRPSSVRAALHVAP